MSVFEERRSKGVLPAQLPSVSAINAQVYHMLTIGCCKFGYRGLKKYVIEHIHNNNGLYIGTAGASSFDAPQILCATIIVNRSAG